MKLTVLTAAILPALAAALCNHTASDGVGLAPVNGSCGNSTINIGESGICGGYGAVCTTNSDCTNSNWCCSNECVGTCSVYGVQHPGNGTTSPVGQYNGTFNPVQVYTGDASSMGINVGLAIGFAALFVEMV
jgi:hypothetical protein